MKNFSTPKNSYSYKAVILAVSIISSVQAHASIFGPKNFEDCILNGMKGVNSDQAANAVTYACEKKFPDKKSAEIDSEPKFIRFSALSQHAPAVNQMTANLEIINSRIVQTGTNSYGVKSFDYGHHLSIEITNRNHFSIDGIEIGFLKSKKSSAACSWNPNDYSEIHTCYGQAGATSSGAFKCQIPRINERKYGYCITGFHRSITLTESREFVKKYITPYMPK